MGSKRIDSFLRLRKIYKWLNDNNVVEIVTIGLLIAGLVCDFWFKYERELLFSTLGPIIFVVWTFTVTLIIFYLGRMDHERYGIRIVDIMVEDLEFKQIVGKVIFFVFQLVVLLGTIIFEGECTLICCSASQVVIMVYVFVMVCVEPSDINIEDTIKKRTLKTIEFDTEGKAGVDWMVAKMLRVINYSDNQEQLFLVDFLCEVVADNEKDKGVQSFAKAFIGDIIANCENRLITIAIINNALVKVDSIPAKRGIAEAVVLHSDVISVEMIFNTDFSERNDIILWAIAHCLYYCNSVNRSYLRMTAQKLRMSLGQAFEKEDEEKWIREYWIELKMDIVTVDSIIEEPLCMELARLSKLL